MTTDAAHAADMERAELLGEAYAALTMAIQIAEEARVEWDNAPSGMRAGKLLIALSGNLPRYRADIDRIHATLAKLDARDAVNKARLAALRAQQEAGATA